MGGDFTHFSESNAQVFAKGSARYVWRAFATAWSFFVFALGSLVLAFLILFLAVLPLKKKTRERTARRCLRALFQVFRLMMEKLGLFRLRVIGRERLPQDTPFLLVSNHPSLIDAPLLLSLVPNAVCVANERLCKRPVLRFLIPRLGFVTNDDGEHIVNACRDKVLEGSPLLLFPEGTRSPASGLGVFYRGASSVALRSGVPLVPAVIRASRRFLSKDDRWYHVADAPIDLEIELCYPINLERFRAPGQCEREAAYSLTDYLTRFYRDTLFRDGSSNSRTGARQEQRRTGT